MKKKKEPTTLESIGAMTIIVGVAALLGFAVSAGSHLYIYLFLS